MRHRRSAALVAAALMLALSGCGASKDASGGKPSIAIVSKGFQQQFWQSVKKGAQQEAEERGAEITFQGPATESDVETQVTQVTNAVGRDPDALGLAALDSRATEPILRKAARKDIPVIAFDSGVDSEVPLTTVATDNKAAAAEAAEHLAKALGGKGRVAVVAHSQTSGSGIDRRDGFVRWMDEHAPRIELLPVQYGGGDQTKSADITKAIITANPDVDGIYGTNEGSAMGVIQGVKESGRKDIKTVGFDSGKGQIDAIERGEMLGAITQDPLAIGREVVRAALKAKRGEKLPKTINTGFYWYDRKNLDDPKIQSVLYR
ncbi:BMP family ABC transporter substrate-binding protein [Streptomyces diacarni]|uniref:BMP family ABC transporter substrate-binding protein n=2 Tax=Streptomyces diacarni TaxID=2800381 RepID=A0A367EZQ1_9ACTN|nr:BMP family ABC transporter substrate-binding protein [Streptomyces diacarni]